MVGCKWAYKIKTWYDSVVEFYKACLVAAGFTRDFAPVARITSVRSLLAVAIARHWDHFQMDIKNAFS